MKIKKIVHDYDDNHPFAACSLFNVSLRQEYKFWKEEFLKINKADDPVTHAEITFDSVRIGDELYKEAKSWTPMVPVFLNADTGSGKTTFAMNLAKVMYDKTKKPSLLLVPRIATATQVALSILKEIVDTKMLARYDNMLNCGCYSELLTIFREKCNFLDIYTTQSVEKPIARHMTTPTTKYAIVFLDEIHDTWEAADYNPYTEEFLRQVPYVYQSSIRVYLSATDEEIRPLVNQAELSALWHIAQSGSVRMFAGYLSSTNIDYLLNGYPVKDCWGKNLILQPSMTAEEKLEYLDKNHSEWLLKVLWMHNEETIKQYAFFQMNTLETVKETFKKGEFIKGYYYKRNCNNLKYYYFQEQKTEAELQRIANYIKQVVPDNEKVFIYAASIKDGDKLLQLLEGVPAIHLYRQVIENNGPERDAYAQLIRNATVNYKVLICSPLLELGTSIRDQQFRTVFIHGVYDTTELLQAQGRIRKEVYCITDKVNVIISLPSKEKLQQQLNELPREIEENKSIARDVDNNIIPATEIQQHCYVYEDAEQKWHYMYNHLVLQSLKKRLQSIRMLSGSKGKALTDEEYMRYGTNYLTRITAYYDDTLDVDDLEILEKQYAIGKKDRIRQQETAFRERVSQTWNELLEENRIESLNTDCCVTEESFQKFRNSIKVYRENNADWSDAEVAEYVEKTSNNRNSILGDKLCNIINRFVDLGAWKVQKIGNQKKGERQITFFKGSEK